MASWSAGAGTRATLVHTVDVNWQNASTNQTSVHINTYISVSGGTGITNMVGDASWNINTAGYAPGSAFTYSGWSGNNYTLNTADITVNHDVNGNCTIGVYAYANGANSPYFVAASINTSLGLPRLALAPTISSLTADTIKPTTARLGAELASVGHGTSANWTMYYRLQGAGGWTSAGLQADVGGFNYWNLTGLKPGKVYEYYAVSSNNNGDTATSGTQTFTTKPIAGAAAVMMKLAGL